MTSHNVFAMEKRNWIDGETRELCRVTLIEDGENPESMMFAIQLEVNCHNTNSDEYKLARRRWNLINRPKWCGGHIKIVPIGNGGKKEVPFICGEFRVCANCQKLRAAEEIARLETRPAWYEIMVKEDNWAAAYKRIKRAGLDYAKFPQPGDKNVILVTGNDFGGELVGLEALDMANILSDVPLFKKITSSLGKKATGQKKGGENEPDEEEKEEKPHIKIYSIIHKKDGVSILNRNEAWRKAVAETQVKVETTEELEKALFARMKSYGEKIDAVAYEVSGLSVDEQTISAWNNNVESNYIVTQYTNYLDKFRTEQKNIALQKMYKQYSSQPKEPAVA